MSGGSFDYACFVADLGDLMQKREQYTDIGLAFEADGYDDVAAEFAALLGVAEVYDRRVKARLSRLADLAYAMEWQRSGDTGPDRTRAAVEAWRTTMGETP